MVRNNEYTFIFDKPRHNSSDWFLHILDLDIMKIDGLSQWKKGKLPLVTKGILGDKLTYNNASVVEVKKDCFVLVGDKKTGKLNDKDVVAYFMQFVKYPEYRKYIINTLKGLDGITEI